MSTRSSFIREYLRWISRTFQELQQHKERQETFRLVDIKQNKAGNYTLKIQITGKSTFFTCTPQEVASKDQLLEGFSKKDIRTILYFATHEGKKPKYKIVIQEFCEKLNKMIFKLAKKDSTESIEKTAEQISLDRELIKKLNPEDAHLVGYTTAAERMAKEKDEMELLKQKLTEKNNSKI